MNDIVKLVEQGGGLHEYLNSHKIVPQTQIPKNQNNNFVDSWEQPVFFVFLGIVWLFGYCFFGFFFVLFLFWFGIFVF